MILAKNVLKFCGTGYKFNLSCLINIAPGVHIDIVLRQCTHSISNYHARYHFL